MKAQQLSLLTETTLILQASALVPAVKAAMRRVADEGPQSREQIVDGMNAIVFAAGKRLTSGRARGIHKDTLDKWLNPEEAEHVPGILAVHVFCLATGRKDPLLVWLSALGGGAEIMSEEDRYYRDVGKSLLEKEKAVKQFKMIKEREV